MRRDQVLRGFGAVGGGFIIIGAYGSWGALSSDSIQAEIVQSTRHIIAGLAALAVVVLAVPRFRLAFSILCAFLVLVVGVIAYGEWNYEENQTGAPAASMWGLAAVLVGAAIAVLAAATEAISFATKRSPPPPSKSLETEQ